jgi:hypothetical protein
LLNIANPSNKQRYIAMTTIGVAEAELAINDICITLIG